jgi:hypothetical protein
MVNKYPQCLSDEQLEKRYFEILGNLIHDYGYGSWKHYIGEIDIPSAPLLEFELVEKELEERCI